MKAYYGHAATPEHPIYVTERDRRTGNKPLAIAHHLRHNPTGFEWGYGGSGPSDLARSLLLNAFGFTTCPAAPDECQCESRWVESSYGPFRDAVVGHWTKDEDWRYSQAQAVDFALDFVRDMAEVTRDDEELVSTP